LKRNETLKDFFVTRSNWKISANNSTSMKLLVYSIWLAMVAGRTIN